MILGPDSPLLSIPQNMIPKQLALLDGIRVSIQMADLSFSRLYAALHEVSREVKDKAPPTTPLATRIVTDAWAVVDSIHRLRTLVDLDFLHAKKRQAVTVFLGQTKTFKDLRDEVQHLFERFETIVSSGRTTWGTLSWIYWPTPTASRALQVTLIAGAAVDRTAFAFSPFEEDMEFRPPIDNVILHAHGFTADLTAGIRAVERLANWFERVLQEKVPEGTQPTVDNLLIVGAVPLYHGTAVKAGPPPPIPVSKTSLVRDALQAICPADVVAEEYIWNQRLHLFKIHYGGRIGLRHGVMVSQEFFDVHTEEQIRDRLSSWNLTSVLESQDKKGVGINAAGVIEVKDLREKRSPPPYKH